MGVDVAKTIERAKKFLEKNKLREAAAEYESILKDFPSNQECIQALGDLYNRLNEPVRAAQYYGLIFDRLTDSRDVAKAAAVYSRFLKHYQQPPERLARYGLLLQRQNKPQEAIEAYQAAAEQFLSKGNPTDAVACWDKVAQLDPDNPARQLKIAEVGERTGRPDVAARGFLRAGQLAIAGGDVESGLSYLKQAHKLAPTDRSVCLVYGQALLEQKQPARAVEILQQASSGDPDAAFQETFGAALMHTGQLDRATSIFEKLYQGRSDNLQKFFELAGQAVLAGQADKAVRVLDRVKNRMFAAHKQNEFLEEIDRLVETFPKSLQLMEFSGSVYNELNRDSKYFNVLERLFALYLDSGDLRGACEALDRLVEIDPYDFRNQDRVKALEGKAAPDYLRGISVRMAKAVAVSGQATPAFGEAAVPAATVPSEAARARNALDDMIVQAEIFLQYSLANKAIEWLQKIAQAYPGEEERNERLHNLYSQADWWPPSGKPPVSPAEAFSPSRSASPAAISPPSQSGVLTAENVGDIAKISEITRLVYRQSTPKMVLSTAVAEIGKYLGVSRCIAVLGAPGQTPQMASEYCTPGLAPSGGPQVLKLLGQLGRVKPDSLGSLPLRGRAMPGMSETGMETVLAVQLVDKESQAHAGILLVGNAAAREWKSNESYFLEAVGDQLLLCVNHTKLRSLMRATGVADVKTGVLGPGSYQDCLLAESNRAKLDSTRLALIILQIDHGLDLLRQHGESMLERYMEQLAVAVQAVLRQNDLIVKYTAWALAFILPNTSLANARGLAEKLRKVAVGVRPPWDQATLKLSAAAVESVTRHDYESEDIVTDLINRAELCLDVARKVGGGVLVAP